LGWQGGKMKQSASCRLLALNLLEAAK